MHTLARFLFASLLNQHQELAFQVGLRAMRLPVLEENHDSSFENRVDHNNRNQQDGFILSRYPRYPEK